MIEFLKNRIGQFARSMTDNVNIVQYNILCGKLATPESYLECDPADLDPTTRLNRIFIKLKEYTSSGSVICLQEVPQTWLGPLHDFFSSSKYAFITSLYGNSFNDYMGVAIAYPMDTFLAENTSVIHVGNTIPLPREEKRSIIYHLGKILLFLILCCVWFFPQYKKRVEDFGKPEFDEWGYSNKRSNTIILSTLTHRSSGKKFALGTYHMPCAYWVPKVITLHTVEIMKIAQGYSGTLPLILAADCNFDPKSYQYEIVTSGHIKDHKENPDISKLDQEWKHQFNPMISTYKIVNGKEPAVTNQTKTKQTKKLFRATLDYIWYCGSCEPISVEPIKDLSPNIILPNETEPSDHIAIGASFVFGS